MKAVIIRADGSLPTVIDVDGLEDMQRIVGGYIEPVAMPGGCEGYISEEGKLLDMPRNNPATRLWYAALDERGLMCMPGDYCAGDVLVLGPIDNDGESTPVTDAFIALVRAVPS